MNKLSITQLKTVALVMAVVLAFSFTGSGEAIAKWEDNSDDLEGFWDGNISLLIGGAIVVGLVIYLIAKKSGGDDTPVGEEASSAGGESSSTDLQESIETNVYGISSPEYAVGQKFPVDPIVYLKKDHVGVGLGIAF